MRLDLEYSEMRELSAVLDERAQTLLREIAKADLRAFRKELEEEYDRVEGLRRRVQNALGHEQELGAH